MKAEYEPRCPELAQEVLLERRRWREDHPRATWQQIEEEVEKRIARWRAGLGEGLARSSAAVAVGKRAGDEPARGPTWGGMLQARGKPLRQRTPTGEQTGQLSRRYGSGPICQGGFVPAFMSHGDCDPSAASPLRE